MLKYEEDLRINHDALDVECVRQPELFMKYARLFADAQASSDRAKQHLDVVYAELDAEVRSIFAEKGVKITEAVVEGQVIVSKKHKDAYEDYLNKKHDAEILSAAVKSFQQRKDMISELIRLATMGYFATPSVPRDLNEEVKKRISVKRTESEKTGEEETRKRLLRRRNG